MMLCGFRPWHNWSKWSAPYKLNIMVNNVLTGDFQVKQQRICQNCGIRESRFYDGGVTVDDPLETEKPKPKPKLEVLEFKKDDS